MDDKGAVMAAISAAIAAYLEEEQARLTAVPQPKPPAPANMWRVFGRWQAMRTR
jgi:hypothetical protein